MRQVSDEERNEDWLKTLSWDLPATNLSELFTVLGVSDSTDSYKSQVLHNFMGLAAWEAAPERIKQEASEWLGRTST